MRAMSLRSLPVLLVLILTACGAANPGPVPTGTPGNVPPAVTQAPGSSSPGTQIPAWLSVMFTNPDPPDNMADLSVDNFVLPSIRTAKVRIDVTSFDFNWETFLNELKIASRRGVDVRAVIDQEEGKFEEADLRSLRAAGVSIVNGGRSSGLMHDKMIIVDSAMVFIGSWNMSYNDTYRNNNNILRITAPEIIGNYQAKFNEMYTGRKFGAKAEQGAVNPRLTLAGVAVENYFSPPDAVMDKLVLEVNRARRSVRFIAFTYTHAELSTAMRAAAARGVQIQGVIENRGANQGALPDLFCASLPIRTDGNKYTMHHKVMIIDNETVITGSYNYTQSADKYNDDYVIIIRNRALADQFLNEFNKMYSIGETPNDVTC